MTRWFLPILFLFSLPASAALYRISFAGTVFKGSASSIAHPVSENLTGLSIFGSIDYDLALMPTAAVSVSSGVQTLFTSTSDPVWVVRQLVVIPGFPVLGGFTSPFDFPVVPVPATGTENNPRDRTQELQFSSDGNSAIRAQTNFLDDWQDGTLVRRRGSLLGLSASVPGAALPQTPGIVPFVLSGALTGGGSFSLSDFEWNLQNNFFTTSNDVNLTFGLTSIQGEFVVPEPATWILTAAALLALAVRKR